MIKRFIRYYKPHLALFVADMLAALALAACDLFYPMITRQMIGLHTRADAKRTHNLGGCAARAVSCQDGAELLCLILRARHGRENAGEYAPGCLFSPADPAPLLFRQQQDRNDNVENHK